MKASVCLVILVTCFGSIGFLHSKILFFCVIVCVTKVTFEHN